MGKWFVTTAIFLGACGPVASLADQVQVKPLLEALRGVGPRGEGHRAAIPAWQKLAQADPSQIPEILQGMEGASPLADNWIRAAADAVFQRSPVEALPLEQLERFIVDVRHAPRARRAAYEMLVRVDSTASRRLLPGMLRDPSLELRRDAVAGLLSRAAELLERNQQEPAKDAYRQALSAARDLDQIQSASQQLAKLGEQVDLPRHFGFITRWHLIGPFDNGNNVGFDTVYPPEQEIRLDATYPGKSEQVRWIEYETSDQYGMVDLNVALGKHHGAIAYAYREFVADEARAAELRLGCITANKVWLNGQLLTTNYAYHEGTRIDQYTGRGRLRKGSNSILVKVAQNEQTEDWAQNWGFQLRVCDEFGTAILSRRSGGEDGSRQ